MSSVPKFGSFKPKEAHSKQCDEEHERRHSEKSPQGRKEDFARRRHERGHDRDNSPHDHRHRKHHPDPRRGSPSQHRQKEPIKNITVPDEPEESDWFFIDRRGDPKNVEFGSLHRYSVPAYHRYGRGRLVGAAQSLRLDREQSTDKSAVLTSVLDKDHAREERPLKAKQPLKSERKLHLIAAAVSSTEDLLQRQSDFIALRPGLKRKRKSPSPELVSTVDYRSIEGKAKASTYHSGSDSASASDSDNQFTEDAVELQVRLENATLSKQTKQTPQDVGPWLKLIAHQAKVIRPHGDRLNFVDTRAIADVRLAIYKKALQQIKAGKSGHERLLLGMLDEFAVVWEASKLAEKWREVLTQCPTSIALWTKYLNFIQTDHVNFSYETCKVAHLQCLQILRNAYKAEQASEEVKLAQIWVTLRLTTFIRDAGYDEFAYSIWQVLLEMTFFKPAGLSDKGAVLTSLEDFWDADVPRIGEEGASGWAHHAEDPASSSSRKTQWPECASLDVQGSIEQFTKQESELQQALHLPAAVDDEDEVNEDPHRQVMFTDVKPVIEVLLDDLPAELLLDAFLIFVGLPLMSTGEPDSPPRAWQQDPYLARHNQVEAGALLAGFVKQTTSSLLNDAFVGFKQHAKQSDGLNELASFIDRLLDQLLATRPHDDTLAEYYLAFRLATNSAEAPKLAKKLLKARPSSLRLYNAFALVEAYSNRLSKAQEVWKTAIQMSGQFADGSMDDLVLLWHSWIFCLLRVKDERKALHTLLAMPDNMKSPDAAARGGGNVSAAQRLKASRHFEEMWERLTHTGKADLAALYAECHIWFAYLTGHQAIATAMEISEKYASRAETSRHRIAEELVHQAQAGLIRAHLQHHRLYRPADVRLALSEGLHKFPDNALLIDVYDRAGTNSCIEDRLRSSLRHHEVGSESSLVVWAHFLNEEVRRCDEEASGSTANAVRSSFNRALLIPYSQVKHSIALWTMWLQFESSRLGCAQDQKSAKLAKARQVFLDGLRMLPWCKSWIVAGLKLFSHEGGMSEKELKQVYNILSEREFRLRVNMGEIDV